jgi:hypothetical protein
MSDALAVVDAVAKRHPEEITEEARRLLEEDTPS